MSTTRSRPLIVLLALVTHLIITARVWKDIERRPRTQLRGNRKLWRILTALNTGNSVVYLLYGVRRH